MKRLFFLTFLCCLLIVALVPLVQAEGEPLVITPYRDGPYHEAAVGQEVIIRAGWGACTRGFAEASRHASLVEMAVDLDGSPWLTVQPGHEYWGPPAPSPADPANVCVMPTESVWWTEMLYSLGELDAGTYDLHFVWTFSHPLRDGGDYDGDGRPDQFTTDNFFIEENITIFVQ